MNQIGRTGLPLPGPTTDHAVAPTSLHAMPWGGPDHGAAWPEDTRLGNAAYGLTHHAHDPSSFPMGEDAASPTGTGRPDATPPGTRPASSDAMSGPPSAPAGAEDPMVLADAGALPLHGDGPHEAITLPAGWLSPAMALETPDLHGLGEGPMALSAADDAMTLGTEAWLGGEAVDALPADAALPGSPGGMTEAVAEALPLPAGLIQTMAATVDHAGHDMATTVMEDAGVAMAPATTVQPEGDTQSASTTYAMMDMPAAEAAGDGHDHGGGHAPGHGDPAKDLEHEQFMAVLAIADNPPEGSGGKFTAVASGSWFDPATWAGGQVPDVDDAFVIIPEGITVLYDGVSDTRLAMVRVDGKLDFSTTQDTRMVVDSLMVNTKGELAIGHHGDPVDASVKAEIIIADSAFIDRTDRIDGDIDNDPRQLSLGLVSHGTVHIIGAEKTAHLEVAQTPLAGQTSILLSGTPEGWQVGDTILLTGTRYVARGTETIDPTDPLSWQTQDETFTITSVVGNRVFLDHAVQYNHDTPGVQFAASVANLTRNIEIRSAAPDDIETRGHVMLMHNDHVVVENAAFIDLGRTDKSRDQDDFALTSDGTNLETDTRVVVNGEEVRTDAADITNIRGRYALHLHRISTEPGASAADISGNVVIGSPGWGLVQHDSAADLHDNVVYGAFGAGIVGETGNEIGTWENNLVVKVPGRTPDGVQDIEIEKNQSANHDFGVTGVGYWFEGRLIEATGNISATTGGTGFFYRADAADDIDSASDSMTRPEIAWGQPTIENRKPPIRVFADNESYGTEYGLIVVGNDSPRLNNDGRSIIDGYTTWEFGFTGVRLQYSSHYTLQDITALGARTPTNEPRIGITVGVSTLDITVMDAVIRNVNTGIVTADSFTTITQQILWGATDAARNAAFDDFGHHFIDISFGPGMRYLIRPGTPPGRTDLITYQVINSATLNPNAPLTIDFDDASLFASWDGTATTPARTASLRGTKTDTLGTVAWPFSEERLELDEATIQRHLEEVGYYTVDGRRVILVDTVFSDRVTAEMKVITHTIELDAAWQLPEHAHDLGGLPNFTAATRYDLIPIETTHGHTELQPVALQNDTYYAPGLRDAALTATSLTIGTWLAEDLAAPSGPGTQIDARLGDDTVTGNNGRDTLLGGDGDDSVDGGVNHDRLFGNGGMDTLHGAGGDDTAVGDAGDDLLEGQSGDDSLSGGEGDDTLEGDDTASAGADMLDGGEGADLIMAGAGGDMIAGGADADTIDGGSGNDQAGGGAGSDTIAGGEGHDTLFGEDGDDTVDAGDGADSIGGDAGMDMLAGGDGDDTLSGGDGMDALDGGTGDDLLDGGMGDFDEVSYASAIAAVEVSLAAGTATGGAGSDTLVGLEFVEGSAFADTLIGSDGANSLFGGLGADVLEGGGERDVVDGGEGLDTARYAGASSAVLVSLAVIGIGQNTRGAGIDTLFGIEALEGSAHADTLAGAEGANTLDGGGGDDLLDGGMGDDLLIGGAGSDTITALLAGGPVAVALGAGGNGTASGPDGSDTLVGIEAAVGSAFDDTMTSNAAGHTLTGGDGNDLFGDIAGNDRFEGGAGVDTLSYAGATAAVSLSLFLRTAQATGGAGLDTILDIENIEGTGFADTLTGSLFGNRLDGGSGDDSLSGGEGNDTLVGGDGDDQLVGGNGDDDLQGGAGFDTASYMGATGAVAVSLAIDGVAQNTGAGGINTLAGIEGLVGSGFGDTLAAGDAASRLDASGGSDSLTGGLGNDTVLGGADNDTAEGGAGADSIEGGSGADLLSGGEGDDTLLAGAEADTVVAGAGHDTVDGGNGADLIAGGDGDDTLLGNSDADSLDGGEGSDSLDGAAGRDLLLGAGGADTLLGGGDADTLEGGAEADSLDGGAAADQLAGGGGADTLLGDVDADTLDGGAEADSLGGGSGSDQLTGADGDDTILGGSEADTLDGGEGSDRLDGGDGTDTARYTAAGGGVAVSLVTGLATGAAGLDTLVGIETVEGSAFADTLTGDGNANALLGGDGDDILEGGLGADRLDGGAGLDTARYAGATAGVAVSLALQGESQNTRATGFDTLFGFEALEGSAFADTLTGNTGAETLTGAGGNDELAGGLGNDLLIGGAGSDTASYVGTSGAVAIALAAGGNGTVSGAAGFDTLTGIEAVVGTSFADTLTSDGAGHTLTGGNGQDRFEDTGGNDRFEGGSGVDTLSYAGAAAAVSLSLAIRTAQATGGAGSDTILDIENLEGTGFADTVTGSTGANRLEGGSGADSLSGGDGNDTLEGGDGDDQLVGGNGSDVLAGGAGFDTTSFVSTGAGVVVSLALEGVAQNTGGAGINTLSGVEAIIGSAFADTLTAGLVAARLDGGVGNDSLGGGQAEDTLIGSAGGDTVDAGAGNDTVDGGSGNDQLAGGDGDDTLLGNSDADSLDGGEGSDSLDGAAGRDLLLGAGGADTLLGGGDADTLEGGAEADSLDGGAAADQLAGGDGADTLLGDVDADTLDGGAEADSLGGGSGSDQLTGADGDDTILGGSEADTLDGGEGSDRLDGGDGTDTARYTAAGGGVAVSLVTGLATGAAGLDTLVGIETVEGSAFADTVTGDGNANALLGGDGDDILEGGLGSDRLDGGAGLDTARYAGATAGVAVSLALQGVSQNTRATGLDTLFGFEALEGSAFADTLTGATAAETLLGADGNDSLDGAGGSDLLVGDTGNDVILGGAGNDTLAGGDGNDDLEGGTGNDLIDAGTGSDTVSYASASGSISIALDALGAGTVTGSAGADTLLGAESLEGSAFADTLTSLDGDHSLNGLGGNDRLEDSGGNDRFDGGDGRDIVSYAGVASAVTVSLTNKNSQATGGGGTDILQTIEDLEGSGFDDSLSGDLNTNRLIGLDGADSLAGNDGADTLEGGDGDDQLTGGAGNDVLTGGLGFDTASYVGASSGVVVSLAVSGVAQNTLGAGSDQLSGIEGLIGSGNGDTLTGGSAADRLDGAAGNDSLVGGSGNDTLIAGGGVDTMAGGTGADSFLFTPAGGNKRITDFSNVDLLEFSGFGTAYDTVAEILATGREQTGSGGLETVLKLPNPGSALFTTVILEGVSLASLDASDFGLISP